MKHLLTILFTICLCSSLFAQKQVIYTTVDEMPQFAGIQSCLEEFICDSLRYPISPQKLKQNQQVTARFVVDTNGNISNITILKSNLKVLSQEVIRLIKTLPNFVAATHNGKKVAVYYTLPITFYYQPIYQEEPIYFIEQQAQYVGGEEELINFIQHNIKYPDIALQHNIEGGVFVEFVIKPDGKVGNIKVLKSPHPAFIEEVIRLFKLMPNWYPARIQGKRVMQVCRIPIKVKLR